MFRCNTAHQQNELFGYESLLGEAKRAKLKDSPEWTFYQLIYRQIPEREFAVLYSEKKSRPNAPINTMVAALILKHQRAWSYKELLDHIDFDLKTRLALGLRGLDETPFVESTIFNFQNRLAAHAAQTGENLLEYVFDRLTAQQLQALELKTNIQRADSFLAASNIRDYSRLQLIIEVLQRFCRLLTESDLEELPPSVAPYLKKTSGQYIYQLDPGSTEEELRRLGQLYRKLLRIYEAAYGDTEAWKLLQRVFTEHFSQPDGQVQLRPADELHSGCLQSPDDPEATFREKAGQTSKGQVIHLAETAHPDNQLNLITDLATETNNTDDGNILEERVGPMKAQTPDLSELHVDGGYGSDGAEAALREEQVTLIQTAIRGRTAQVPMHVEPDGEGYRVRCPHGQTVRASRTPKRWKAEFDRAICAGCPLAGKCPGREGKTARRWYFTDEQAARQRRWRRWQALPEARQSLRPNVEATIRQMQGAMKNKKLKVRGAFKTHCYGVLRAIAVNFGRIARYLADPDTDESLQSLASAFWAFMIALFGHSSFPANQIASHRRKMLHVPL